MLRPFSQHQLIHLPPESRYPPPMYQRRAAKFGQALGLVGDSHFVFGAENTYFLTNPCQPYKTMLLFVSKSQATPAQAGDVKLKGPTGSAGCRQRAAVILPDPLLCGFLKRRSRQARSNLAAGSIKAAQRPLCVFAVSKTGYTEHKTLSDVGVPRPEGVFLRAETSGQN